MKILIRVFIKLLTFPFRLLNKLKRMYYTFNGASIGRNTYISPQACLDVHRPGKIIIGENCYITRNVVILCHTDTRRGGPLGIWEGEGGKRVFGDVVIGNNVFIGVNSVVMPGVKIGDNAIVGALSLVMKDVPAGKIAVGAPAKIVGETMDHVRNG